MPGKARQGSWLWTIWENLLERHPRRVVLIDAAKDVSWTMGALGDTLAPFSDRLQTFAAGERIAFCLPNGAEWLALFLALQRAGLAAVPLDGGTPVEGCLEIARHIGASALFRAGEFYDLEKSPVRSKTCCCIKVTSGSGAFPKAIECRAEHLLADGDQIIRTMGLRPRDLNLAAIPLGHSYGLGNLVMPLLLQGTGVVCAAEYVPRQLAEWIERYGVTVFPGVPALFRVLAALPAGPELKSLRLAISAGAVLAPSVARAFLDRYGIKIHNFYGSSETGGICYDRTGQASLSGRSVGKPLEGVSVTVKAGRMTVISPAVAARGGRFRLNDLGEWTARGELALAGRAGEQGNIGGKKVHPLEVDRVLRALPGVTDAVVWLGEKQGRHFLAVAVETTCTQAELELMLGTKLPAWKLPKTYRLMAEFPRTARGKIDREALRKSVEA